MRTARDVSYYCEAVIKRETRVNICAIHVHTVQAPLERMNGTRCQAVVSQSGCRPPLVTAGASFVHALSTQSATLCGIN